MPPRTKRIKWLDRALHYGPYITLCTSEDEFKVVFARLKCPDDVAWLGSNGGVAKAHFLHQEGKAMLAVICVRLTEDYSPATLASLLTHEAVHVWQEWTREIGESAPGDEMEAYAIQNIAYVLIEEAFSRQQD